MKYYMLLQKGNSNLLIRHNYKEMINKASECEKLDFTDSKSFRLIIDDEVYALQKQYVFINENITLYGLSITI